VILERIRTALRVVTDSREVEPGDLFLALRGERVDGHDFVAEAAERGASAVVVERKVPVEIEQLVVDDVLGVLQLSAQEKLVAMKAKVVAITGSVGKTTTKGFLATLLGGHRRAYASKGNRNSQVGLPLSILEAPEDAEVVVLEMGMTEPGQIRRLCEIAPPDIAVVTNIALVHVGFFSEGIEGVARAKAEIFERAKLGIASLDSPFSRLLAEAGGCPKRSYSVRQREADLYGQIDGQRVCLFEGGVQVVEADWDVPMRQCLHNLLAAAAAARAVGLGWRQIEEGIGRLELPSQRFEVRECNGVTVVDDTYNACALSICAALDSLPDPGEGGRRIAVLGQMVELGEHEPDAYRQVAEHALGRVDHLICLGERLGPMWEVWQREGRDIKWCMERQELADYLSSAVEAGDVVLVKGSRAYAMEEFCDLFSGPLA
jgi:UDP-N-acetylmuramoyl-tripeptide--D-alanyl-D-alanine ligase